MKDSQLETEKFFVGMSNLAKARERLHPKIYLNQWLIKTPDKTKEGIWTQFPYSIYPAHKNLLSSQLSKLRRNNVLLEENSQEMVTSILRYHILGLGTAGILKFQTPEEIDQFDNQIFVNVSREKRPR